MNNEVYEDLVASIVSAQLEIIGPVAIDQANLVEGITVTKDLKVTIEKEPLAAISALVQQYKTLFGQISVDVCKEAVGRVAHLSAEMLPASLR